MTDASLAAPPYGRGLDFARARFDWVWLVASMLVTASTLTRIALLMLGRKDWSAGTSSIPAVLGAGLLTDILVAFWVVAPFVFWLAIIPRIRYASIWHRRLRRVGIAAATFVAIFVAVAEMIFFEEFNGRFNFVAVDYLLFPAEVITNIWESYPTAWIVVGVILLTAFVLRLLRRPMSILDARGGPSLRGRLQFVACYAVLLTVLTLSIPRSLRRVTDDRLANEVATNGYLTFFEALLGQDAPYEGLYATRPDAVVFPRLHRLLHDGGPGSHIGSSSGELTPRQASATSARSIRSPGVERRMNVVMILEESLGSNFIGALNPRDTPSLTPSYDSLAEEGLMLTRAYSTGNRTIRALEATTSSLPPLPGISIVRRPQSVDLFTLPNVLRANGYATAFIYGGRALFDGMGRYMLSNGMEKVIEQGDYPSGLFTTAWGVADEAIFDRTLVEMDLLHAAGTPFFHLVLSVSNHRPYTYPRGRIPENPDEHRRVFAVRYADWALGRFMREVRSRPYFDNTLFVLMGDHGARVYGAAEIPLASYEIPVVFYAPSIIPPGGRVGTLASSIDIAPTVLGLLGLDYESKFFGRDLFGGGTAPGRALMTHNSKLALMRGSRMAVLGLRGSIDLYDVDSVGTQTRVTKADPADRELIEDAIAYFSGADRLYRRGAYQFAPRPTRKELAISSPGAS